MNRPSTKWLILIPVVLSLAVHFNVLHNEFGWDDEKIIQDMKLVTPDRIWTVFFPSSFSEDAPRSAHKYYRPMVSLSYHLDFMLWGGGAFGFHLSVWLMHALNAALVYGLAQGVMVAGRGSALSGGRIRGSAPTKAGAPPDSGHEAWRPYVYVPLIAASLFAVHPLHAEAVAWIAGRNDVLCTTFALAALVFYLRSQGTGGKPWFALAMLAFLLALLTKELAVAMILMFPLMDFSVLGTRFSVFGFGKKSEIPNPKSPTPNTDSLLMILLRFIPPLLVLGLYFLLRSAKLQAAYGGASAETVTSASSWTQWIAAYGLYLKQMLLPFPHQPFIASVPSSSLWVLLSALALTALAAGFLAALGRGHRLPVMALAWMILLLAPGVSVAVLRVAATPAAERYAYAASAGMAMLVAWALIAAADRRVRSGGSAKTTGAAVAAVLGTVLILGGVSSWHRNAAWRTPISFWEAAVAAQPDSGFPYRELATQYYQERRHEEAEPLYLRAIELDDAGPGTGSSSVAESLNGLASLYYAQQKYDKAEPRYLRVLEIKETIYGPDHPEVGGILNNLGTLYNIQRRYEKAEPLYLRSLAIREKTLGPDHPDVAKTLNNLAGLYYIQGKLSEAEGYFRRSLAIRQKAFRSHHPSIALGLSNLAAVNAALGNDGEAEKLYLESLAVYEAVFGADHPEILKTLRGYSQLLRKANNVEESAAIEARIKRIEARKP
jgi:tetratricopeptide (TPR) repeat protein